MKTEQHHTTGKRLCGSETAGEAGQNQDQDLRPYPPGGHSGS